MTNLQLFELLTDIDSSYIEAAGKPIKRIGNTKLAALAAMAACVCIAIVAGFAVSSNFSDRVLPSVEQEQTTVTPQDLNGEVTQSDVTTTYEAQTAQITDNTTSDITAEVTDPPVTTSSEAQTALTDGTVNGLPVLSINEYALFGGGMGFEGLMYRDISEVQNGNPWNEETQLETLPVYKNLGYSYYGVQNYLESDEMVARVKETAKLLGIEITDWDFGTVFSQIGENEFLDETTYAEGANADIIIRAFANGDVFINYEKARKLPDSINFTRESTTHEDGLIALEYLSGEYAEFMNYTEAECTTINGDYNIYGEQGKRDYIIYEGSGDYAEDIINYNLNYTEFIPEFGGEQGELDTGNLGDVRRYDHLVCAEKVGDYPLISADEAEELLFSGAYLTSVPHDIVETDSVAKVELVYTKGVTSQYFMPVYKFYIPLSGKENGHNFDRDNGLITFGIYYVPAVSGEYISDMPTNAGRFN